MRFAPPAYPALLVVLAGATLVSVDRAEAGERIAVGARTGGGTAEIYQLDLGTGVASGWEVRSGGERLDAINVQQNLFEAIGRPLGPAAPRGSVFLFSIDEGGGKSAALAILEAESGYVGFLNRIGKDRKVGALLGAIGRPGTAAAARDGLHTLVPVANSNSSSRGFYLVHGGSGACVFMSEVEPEKGAINASGCSALPLTTAGWSSAPLRAELSSFVLVDVSTGASWLVRSTGSPTELIATQLALDLPGIFGTTSEEAPARRFSISQVWTSSGNGMVVADANTGKLALVSGLENPAPQVIPIGASFQRSSGLTDNRAVLVPVFAGNGSTSGVLVFDAAGFNATLLSDFDSGVVQARAVELRR